MSKRLIRASVVLGFALLVGKLFATGEMARYMSPALDPLTALAGLLLGVMGILEVGAALAGRRVEEHDGSGDQATAGLMLFVPIVIGMMIAPVALGAGSLAETEIDQALMTFGPTTGRTAAVAQPSPAGVIDDVPALLSSLRSFGDSGIGQPVRVSGYVVPMRSDSGDELALLRYSIVHCVADARALAFLVIAPTPMRSLANHWVEIEGRLDVRERDRDRLVTIVADSITPTAEPRNPYISP